MNQFYLKEAFFSVSIWFKDLQYFHYIEHPAISWAKHVTEGRTSACFLVLGTKSSKTSKMKPSLMYTLSLKPLLIIHIIYDICRMWLSSFSLVMFSTAYTRRIKWQSALWVIVLAKTCRSQREASFRHPQPQKEWSSDSNFSKLIGGLV